MDNDQGCKLVAVNKETGYEDFVKIIYKDYI